MDEQDRRSPVPGGGQRPAHAGEAGPAPTADSPAVGEGPQQLDPRVVRVWVIGGAIGAGLGALALAAADLGPRIAGAGLPWPPGIPALAVLVFGGLMAWRLPQAKYRRWSYELAEDALELRHGVLERVHSAIPYWRVQYIDVQQGPIERALGLARLVVHTAAASTDAEIPGVAAERAEALRRVLLARAGIGDAV
jgi:uncharacterized protein